VGGWLGPGAELDVVVSIKILSCRELNIDYPSSSQNRIPNTKKKRKIKGTIL
jgi:hypothetical protein